MKKKKYIVMSKRRLPYSVDFTALPDGGLPSGWTGATWAISSATAKNTPTLGSELVANGNMETGDPPDSWVSDSSAVLASVADERTGGSGSASMSITNGAALFGKAKQTVTASAGDWLFASAWLKRVTQNAQLRLTNTSGATSITFAPATASTSWVQSLCSGRVVTDAQVRIQGSNVSGQENRADDVSVKAMTLSTLIASRLFGSPNVSLTIAGGTTSGMQWGMIGRLDSTSNPQNFLYAIYNGTNAKLVKCVAGTYTDLIDTAAAGLTKMIMSGTSVSIWNGGSQIGATQTVSDAGILNNTRHGLFSTYSGNTFTSFSAVAA